MKQENKRENNQRETGKLGVAGVKLINCYVMFPLGNISALWSTALLFLFLYFFFPSKTK